MRPSAHSQHQTVNTVLIYSAASFHSRLRLLVFWGSKKGRLALGKANKAKISTLQIDNGRKRDEAQEEQMATRGECRVDGRL